MVAVDAVASWAQLVTACAAPSANITLSPTFEMGARTVRKIDFRLVCLMYGSLICKCCAEFPLPACTLCLAVWPSGRLTHTVAK
jgi:hypothetical protein